jgi:EF-hand domain pair/EF hand
MPESTRGPDGAQVYLIAPAAGVNAPRAPAFIKPFSTTESLMRRNLIIAVAAALVPAALLASESEHYLQGSALEHWDTNADGIATRDEAEAAALERTRKLFDSLDADKNGSLTKAEVDAARNQRREAMREHAQDRFKAADSDGDGKLSKDEAGKGMPMVARRFDQLDADKDGALTAEELTAHKRGGRN